ncbi:MAG: peptidylprolyl isomerase [Thermoanaerobaculia bacterium]|nr:peptidylprolyl isomerase [Thermoanaerobaculia bacterium]
MRSSRGRAWIRCGLAAAAAAFAAACATAPQPSPSLARPAATPVVDDHFDNRALLLMLADRRLYEPQALEAMLGGTLAVRRALAVALGRIGDPRGRSLLQGLLVDLDAEVRRAAAFALGELGAAEAERALLVAAVDDDPEVGALAVEALGKLGAPLAEVRRTLGALAPAAARSRLAPFLFRFAQPGAVDAAADLLATSTAELRRGGAYALGRAPQAAGLGLLRGLLADGDPLVRAAAARGLGALGGLDDLSRLLPLLDDPAPSPPVQALRAGAAILGRAEALPPLAWGTRMAALLDAPRPGVRAAALEAAGSFLPHPELDAALRRQWAGGEPRARELALAALVAGGAADAPALVLEAAGAADRWLRGGAAYAAARLGDRELLQSLARDPEPAVRVAALDGLARLGTDSELVAALADRHPAVRASALEALAESPELPTARIAALIDEARRDGAQNEVRLAGVRALTARAATPPAAERNEIVAALGRLADDADWLVRRAAAEALAALGEPRPPIGPVATGRDLAAYRELLRQTAAPRRVAIDTERGRFVVELHCPEAPTTCLSFLQLAAAGFFDGTRWHRVVPDFVVQGGDPEGDGWGGPGYVLRDEVNRHRYARGTVGMALSGPDTGGSQFFVTLSPQPHLDGGYTVFGRVVEGDRVLDELRQGDRLVAVRELPAAALGAVR